MDDDDLYLGIGTVTGISGRPSRKKKQQIGFIRHDEPGLGIHAKKKGDRPVRSNGGGKLAHTRKSGRQGKHRA